MSSSGPMKTALLLVVLLIHGTALRAGDPVVSPDIVFKDRFGGWPEIPIVSELPSERHTPRPLGTTGADQGYYEYLPAGYDPSLSYPLMLFIHGLGENGDGGSQLDRVLSNGPPRLINNNSWDASRPFIVLSPQRSGGGCTSASQIAAFIEHAVTDYAVDERRIYLTGLSCGAIGGWQYAGQQIDDRIAAMVPIAGNGISAFNSAGCALGALPIWAFHGDSDGTVSPNGSTVPINGLLACDSPVALDSRLTLYPGVGHNSWRDTYDLSAGHNIYRWMLMHQKTNP